ncbi:MAG TPA: tetratricopeptide repeat protein [Rhizomicrobium sp.]|nr:tetratricopeptide repeat protein [Rhizomicrobium sp.]
MQQDMTRLALLYRHAFDCHRRGDLAGAESLCLQILAARSDYFEALNMLGALRLRQGRHSEALALIEAALRIDRRCVPVILNYADILSALGRWDEALQSYDRLLVLAPDNAQALNHRGIALRRLGRPADAVRSFDRALRAQPDFPAALSNRGAALHDLDRFEDALMNYDAALKRDPRNAGTWNNRGLALLKLARLGEALDSFDAGLASQPRHAELLANRGVTLREIGRHDEALASLDQAIAADPVYANAHWNKGVTLLLRGDFAQGLPLYEWRKRLSPPVEARNYPQPLWAGKEDIGGKTLFLYAGQGLGDTIQFYRFAAPLLARGARVILSVQDRLLRLLENASPKVELVESKTVPADFDYHIPLMSLPLALSVTIGTIPAPVPYLEAEPERVAHWAARIGKGGFKIGISWQGARGGITSRATPLAGFEELSRLADVRLIGLQKGLGSEHLSSPPWLESLGKDFDNGPDAFLDSAAVMANLDLVITLDSALAHLAGALGRPAWIALRRVPDWRWFLNRDDSPWYPSVTLFRQETDGDWAGVFAQMRARLLRSPSRARREAAL